MSFWKFGPTELRIVLAAGTLVLLFHPIATIHGTPYLLFDIGGLVAIAGLALTTIVSVVGHIRELYVAERLSDPAGEEDA
jgi:hypothetical protein